MHITAARSQFLSIHQVHMFTSATGNKNCLRFSAAVCYFLLAHAVWWQSLVMVDMRIAHPLFVLTWEAVPKIFCSGVKCMFGTSHSYITSCLFDDPLKPNITDPVGTTCNMEIYLQRAITGRNTGSRYNSVDSYEPGSRIRFPAREQFLWILSLWGASCCVMYT
jgi:hypothetical protein